MNRIYLIIAITALFFIGLQAEDESWKLYETTGVAVVEITVDPLAVEWMYNNVWSDSMHNATVHFSNEFIDETIIDVGFRLRGNTSRIAMKKSFKLSFNTFVAGRQFYDVEKLNLNGEHNDPSIIRSKLCWDGYNNIGQISSRASYAAVYINGEYYGLYISVEHIDDEFLNKNFADDSGNLWKCHYPARLNYLGDNPDMYKLEQDGRRVYELKTNTEEDDYTQLARMINLLSNTPEDNIHDSLETHIDIASVLKYAAVDVITGSWDDYWYGKSNFYIYHEPTKDKFYVIPFDYDNTYGVDWQGIDWTERDIYTFKHPDANRPLIDRFMEIPEYKNLYSHFLQYFRNNAFELSNMDSEIEEMKAAITDYALADYYRTLDYGFDADDFHMSYSLEHYQNQHIKNGLREFIHLRNASIDQQIDYEYSGPIIYKANYLAMNTEPPVTLYFYASIFSNIALQDTEIEFYPEDSQEPQVTNLSYMPIAETDMVDRHDNYEGSLEIAEDITYGSFRIKATSQNGITAYYPSTGSFPIEITNVAPGSIFINEVLAKNESVNQDNTGEYDDWLELYNPTDEQKDLTGFFLTDNPDNPTKWQFPYGSIVYPGDFLLIWCDEDEGTYHTNFKLSGNGEYVALIHPNGSSVIDSFVFPEQTTDVSYGRIPDGSSEFGFMQPSPAGANNPADAGEEELQITNYELRNYPNPFNPTTTIYFGTTILHESAHIEIYNTKGQLVEELGVRNLELGINKVIWNASEFASGVYFYRLNVADSPIKKMALIK